MRMAAGRTVRRLALGGALIGHLLLASAAAPVGAGPGSAAAPSAGGPASFAATKGAPAKLIDINSASRAQLKTLPGIGDAEAGRIIAGRPYLSKTHLVSDAGIPAGVYQSIRHRIIAVQNQAARAKLRAAAGTGASARAPASQPR